MSQIVYADHLIKLEPGQSVLDGLLSAGHDIPNRCKAGACHSCLMVADEGVIPENSQAGLKDTLKAQRFFLSCRCHPENELKISDARPEASRELARVTTKTWLTRETLRIRLASELNYRAGQYITVWNKNEGRSYSLASVPGLDSMLELHVKVIPDGRVSQWLANGVEEGDSIEIQGPAGSCFYTPESQEQPIILVGIGTGLAPLYGILNDALNQGHQAQITLFVAAYHSSRLYYLEELHTLARRFPQLTVTPCAIENDTNLRSLVTGDINEIVKHYFISTQGMRAYLCGSAERVRQLKKLIFLKGANRQDIYADEFI